MANIYQNLTDPIGGTPLLQLNKYGEEQNIQANVIAKLE
jgi:cysteine synthase